MGNLRIVDFRKYKLRFHELKFFQFVILIIRIKRKKTHGLDQFGVFLNIRNHPNFIMTLVEWWMAFFLCWIIESYLCGSTAFFNHMTMWKIVAWDLKIWCSKFFDDFLFEPIFRNHSVFMVVTHFLARLWSLFHVIDQFFARGGCTSI